MIKKCDDCLDSKQVLISVLMPVYNCELYIKEAVDSILKQTYTSFELLIFDDCSTDQTLSIINKFKDKRIKIINKEKQTGLTASLNLGLKLAKGKYIARMDGDDVSMLTRFEKQVKFLEEHENIVLCGSLYQIYNWHMVSKLPLIHEEIKVGLLSSCCIAHPTVMMRKSIFDKFNLSYNESKEAGEDYDLWSRLVFLGEFYNLDEVLLKYRTHQNQISNVKRQRQIEITNEIKLKMLRKIDENVPEYFISDDMGINTLGRDNYDAVSEKLKYLDKILKSNKEKKIYDSVLFKKYIFLKRDVMFSTIMNSKDKGIKDVLIFIRSNYLCLQKIGFINLFKIFYKSIFINLEYEVR